MSTFGWNFRGPINLFAAISLTLGFLGANASALSTSTDCIINSEQLADPASCSLASPVGSVYSAASAGSSGGLAATVYATVNTQLRLNSLGNTLIGSAYADASSLFSSAGQLRLGEITINVNGLLHEHGAFATFMLSFSDGTHIYTFSCPSGDLGCKSTQILPFYLGTTFSVLDVVSGSFDQFAGSGDGEGSYAYSQNDVSFSLAEANDTPVESIYEGSPSPEPTTMGATCMALLLAALIGYSRDRNSPLFAFLLLSSVLCLASAAAVAKAQTWEQASSCPVEITNMKPPRISGLESFSNALNNIPTNHMDLQLWFKNNTSKTVTGLKVVTAYFDSTEDLVTINHSWGIHGRIKPSGTLHSFWNASTLDRHASSVGWVVLPYKICFRMARSGRIRAANAYLSGGEIRSTHGRTRPLTSQG